MVMFLAHPIGLKRFRELGRVTSQASVFLKSSSTCRLLQLQRGRSVAVHEPLSCRQRELSLRLWEKRLLRERDHQMDLLREHRHPATCGGEPTSAFGTGSGRPRHSASTSEDVGGAANAGG